MNDVVIDTCVIRLYDQPKDKRVQQLFLWLKDEGVLAYSQPLLCEYNRQGNLLIAGLLSLLIKNGRVLAISNQQIKSFTQDRHYKYPCNPEDINAARTVFLSHRKKLVSFDAKLCEAVNGFAKVGGIQPAAVSYASPGFL